MANPATRLTVLSEATYAIGQVLRADTGQFYTSTDGPAQFLHQSLMISLR